MDGYELKGDLVETIGDRFDVWVYVLLQLSRGCFKTLFNKVVAVIQAHCEKEG